MAEDGRLDEILADWCERRDRGQHADPEEVVHAHPDLAEGLRARFAAMSALDEIFSESSLSEGIPERIGEYRVIREIGSGGMGTVYLARDAGDSPVALKVLHPHLLSRAGFFKRFLREAEAGKQVRHENVVRTLDADAREIEGRAAHFLVMEYVEGRTLRELLLDLGTLPEALLREIAKQVASGLACVHAAGIVHRDLKPENVLITDDHRVRIMDLGVARLVEESAVLTQEGQFAGSLHYAAPEQFRGGEVGPAADLYSLGVLLYELATGDNPYRRDEAAAVMSAHLELDPPPATERNPDLSEFLSEVLSTLLAKEPSDRFESAESLLDLLEQGERSKWWGERSRELRKAVWRLPRIPVRRETNLHGRDADLALLCDAWERAREGEGSTALVEGEAGIGKTRLLDAFLGGLDGLDAHVLYGSYPPSGGMGGLSDAILGHLGEVDLPEALTPYLTVTPSLVPAFAAMVSHEAVPAGAAEITGDALHAVFVHLMRGLAAEKPLLWIVEDLHFATPESRSIALSLARALEDHRVLLLLTTRPGIPEDEIAHFSRLESFRRVPLARLGARDVMLLLQDAFRSEALAEKLGVRIALKSDGVPFFVFEMIRGLKEGQFIEELPDGTWVDTKVIEEIEVPSAVRDLVEARLRDLDDEDRHLLDAGAVQGFEFDPDLVARALGHSRIDVLQRLATIERRSGVIKSGAGCRFDHHQIQEVIYEDLMPELRQEYHTLLAEALAEREAVHDREPASLPGERAVFLSSHHLRGSRPEAALPFLDLGLDHLEKAYLNDEAIGLVRRALELPGLIEGKERAELFIRLANWLQLLGRREEQEAVDEAVALAEESGDAELRSRAHRARGAHSLRLCRYEVAQEEFLVARDLAREAGDRSLEAQATGNVGLVLQHLGLFDQARKMFERDRGIAREIGNRREEMKAAVNLGVGLHYLGRLEEARDHLKPVLAIGRKSGDLEVEAHAAINLGNVFDSLGQRDETRQLLERGLAVAREIGSRHLEAVATGALGTSLSRSGCYDEGLEHQRRTLAIARETGDRRSEGISLLNLGLYLADLGDLEEARSLLDRSLLILREIGARREEGYALNVRAIVESRSGNAEEAAQLFEAALALRREISYRKGIAETQGNLGSLLAEEGRPEAARPRLEEALALGQELENPGLITAAVCVLATLPDGDPEAAVAALAEHESSFGHYDRQQARFLLWRATNDPAHLEEAHRLLCHLRDHGPEENRETMIANVPLHRDIMAAWGALGEARSEGTEVKP